MIGCFEPARPSVARRLKEAHEVRAELVLDARAQIGEGPVWLVDEGRLCWVDILGRTLHFFDPLTGDDVVREIDHNVGAVVPRHGGGLVLAVDDGFAALDPASGMVTPLAAVEEDDSITRMNDGRCDAQGRFWAGTMAYEALEHPERGSLYCLEVDGTVRKILGGVSISNGIDWSPDGATMYYIDTLRFAVDAFEFDAERGELGARWTVAEVGGPGDVLVGPDGMTVDEEGCLWVAVWGGSCVRRYNPEGELDMVVELPVTQVTSCAFGGADLQDLYITSASHWLSPNDLAAQPLAGGLFRCRPGVGGRAPNAYRG